jgi:HSP20 family protein
MNRLFGTFFDSPTASPGNDVAGRRWIPAMDLVEGEDSYVLRADLPGLGKDDVKIEFEDNVLTISGARKTEREQRKGGYVRYERASGQFTRSLTLPAGVDAGSIEASFGSGVLEVRIPKPAERKPQRISIGTRAVEGVEVATPDAEAAETTAVAA